MAAVGVEEIWECRSDVIAYDTTLVSQHCVCGRGEMWGGRTSAGTCTHTEIHHHYLPLRYHRQMQRELCSLKV